VPRAGIFSYSTRYPFFGLLFAFLPFIHGFLFPAKTKNKSARMTEEDNNSAA
jgi:hypothetical protein